MELTLDTSVLVSSGDRKSAVFGDCLLVLQEIRAKDQHSIVLDSQKRIESEYRSRVGAGQYAHHWLEFMLKRSRVVVVDRARIPRGTSVRLRDECHLQPRDMNFFVRTALASRDKIIVAQDDDYWGRSRGCLSRDLKISVDSAARVHGRICSMSQEECKAAVLSGQPPGGAGELTRTPAKEV